MLEKKYELLVPSKLMAWGSQEAQNGLVQKDADFHADMDWDSVPLIIYPLILAIPGGISEPLPYSPVKLEDMCCFQVHWGH